jgi:hypothetical protein
VKIGTWNLAGHWSDRHEHLLREQHGDVWLLTEISERVEFNGWSFRCTSARMAPRRHWAAVGSQQPVAEQPDPHPASAAAVIDGVYFCSSVLPWRSCGGGVWVGERHWEKTAAAVRQLNSVWPADLPLVWGGDLNHSLEGRERAGSVRGRECVQVNLRDRALQVPTATLPHRLPECLTIDHVAVPESWTAIGMRVDASGLSDHDLYVVDVTARP